MLNKSFSFEVGVINQMKIMYFNIIDYFCLKIFLQHNNFTNEEKDICGFMHFNFL